jgi:hypothetical protein
LILTLSTSKYSQLYDPIYADAMQPTNIALNTVYKSRGLQLIGVGWSWAVALKLVRYQKDDPQDIAAILKLGSQLKGLQWTRQIMEDWLLNMCSPMGYAGYSPEKIMLTRQKMRDAVKRAQALAWPSQPPATQSYPTESVRPAERPPTVHWSAEHATAHEQRSASRFRTQSFSHTAPHSAPPVLAATTSMPTLAVPHPSQHAHIQLVRPNLTGSANAAPSTVPPAQFPRGFIPYHGSTPPVYYLPPHHAPAPRRIRV